MKGSPSVLSVPPLPPHYSQSAAAPPATSVQSRNTKKNLLRDVILLPGTGMLQSVTLALILGFVAPSLKKGISLLSLSSKHVAKGNPLQL